MRVLLGLLLAAGIAHAQPWKVGEMVPNVRLPTIDGRETVSLYGLRGMKVLLIQFASW